MQQANVGELVPDISDSVDSGKSYRRWPDDRIGRIDSMCPPSAAVRQRVIARSTLSCW